MPISPAPAFSYNLRIKPDYVADLLSELDSDLASYVEKYVLVNENGRIYYVDTDRAVPIRIDAYQFLNYSIEQDSDEDVLLFIQDTTPLVTGKKYHWIQTNVGGNPNDFSVLFEDLT